MHWTYAGETGGVWARGCDKNRGLARKLQASNELSISAKIFDPSPTATRVPLSCARRLRSPQAKWRGEISKSRAWRWRTSSFAILQWVRHREPSRTPRARFLSVPPKKIRSAPRFRPNCAGGPWDGTPCGPQAGSEAKPLAGHSKVSIEPHETGQGGLRYPHGRPCGWVHARRVGRLRRLGSRASSGQIIRNAIFPLRPRAGRGRGVVGFGIVPRAAEIKSTQDAVVCPWFGTVGAS